MICTLLIFAIIQMVMVLFFIRTLSNSQPIDIQDTKQIDITVEDSYYFKIPSEYRLIVFSDSTKYLFESRATFEEYSVSKLYETISVGDRLSLIYYEADSALGKINIVVDARTETETYRSFEEYNRGKEGVPTAVVIIFSIIELTFCGIVILYIWFNSNIIKGIRRKLKKIKMTICKTKS